VEDCFVLDVPNRKWTSLPPLPEPRYSVTVQLWHGRLHAAGGSKPDRNTPATNHWSIAVSDGKALENKWREEPPIPRGGPHRASAVVDDKFYLFGGQEGDYIAIPGDPEYRCTGKLTIEDVYPDVYMLEPGASQWKRMADMPLKCSHIEFAKVIIDKSVVILGGMINKNPVTKEIHITDAIQVYDTTTNTWRIVGRLPYRLKATVSAYYDGRLFVTTGQKDKGVNDPRPGAFDRRAWKAKFALPL
jgi:hypothetical protein